MCWQLSVTNLASMAAVSDENQMLCFLTKDDLVMEFQMAITGRGPETRIKNTKSILSE